MIVRRLPRLQRRYYRHASSSASSSTSYSETVLLPKTSFPAWIANGAERLRLDGELSKRCASEDLYEWQLNNDSSKPSFIIHDGPPYANGDVHIGHALNKIIKDIASRYRILRGYRVHFRPGWDCHGLPIELRALQHDSALESTSSEAILKEAVEKLSPLEIRRRSKEFATAAIEEQRNAFKSWACLGDWRNPYLTLDPEYEAKEVELFYELYRLGYVYRDFKPVHWSPSSRTALADAELQYERQHRSKTVYFRMKITNFPCQSTIKSDDDVWALIWTTTPWTLPANDAIFFNSTSVYCVVRIRNERRLYLISEKALDSLRSILGDMVVVSRFEPSEAEFMADLRYLNPITNVEKRFLVADYVDPAKGTGLSHGAFAHGFEDYSIAQKYGLNVECFVDENGDYDRHKYAGSILCGKNVLTKGSDLVLNTWNDYVVASNEITHSYPYDWRTKRPVIIRASKQWFIDAGKLRTFAMDAVRSTTRFYPNWANDRMIQMLTERPSGWCISRQRTWGVPIPIFYSVDGDEHFVDEKVIRHVANLIRKEGSNCWWSRSVQDLLPADFAWETWMLRKGEEIFDIWFDSGISWACAKLPEDNDGKITADLIVEGEDQYRGWFQSLLLTSVALQSTTPYKHVLVHGFVVDDNGQKMSKSVGNVVEPIKLISGDQKAKLPALGVDGLRLWVALNGNDHPVIRLGPQAMAKAEKTLRDIRKVLKYILGVLSDFDRRKDAVDYDDLLHADKYLLHALVTYVQNVEEAYERYDLDGVTSAMLQFLGNVTGSFFINVSKHRLYCANAASSPRRSAQTVLDAVGENFVQTVSPIVPYLAEEYIQHGSASSLDALRRGWPKLNEKWTNQTVANDFETALIPARTQFMAEFGRSNILQLDLDIRVPSNLIRAFRRLQPSSSEDESELRDLMQTAKVSIVESESDQIVISAKKTEKFLCDRCRRYSRHFEYEKLCNFCTDIFKNHK